MPSPPLEVSLHGKRVGALWLQGEDRSPEDWRFAYDAAYADDAQAAPLSVSLPVQAAPFAGAVVRNWFCNLLPEGPVREAIERRMRIAPRDDIGLLAAIGGECAGAVSIRAGATLADTRANADANSDANAREAADADGERDLETLLIAQGNDAGEGAWATLGVPRRLSLAGAQDKIAVVLDADGRIALPASAQASSHILKPESLRLRALRDLEALGLALARRIELNAVDARLVELAGRKALLVERYDRARDANGRVRRLHQEDLCQALGFPAELKYESQGGPSLRDCARLLRTQLRLGPVALQQFLDWIIYNAAIGNADAHAKNLSLLYPASGGIVLAPWYDLVPVLTLPESMIARDPALHIGHATRIDRVGADDWRALAADTGFAPRFVAARVRALTDAVSAAVVTVADDLAAQGADATRMAEAAAAIVANAAALRARLD